MLFTMRLEIKIEYKPGKFVKLFREVEKETYRFQNLTSDIKTNCSGFADLTAQTIRMRFEDEDGDFINSTEDDNRNFNEMLLQAKFIEERNVRKILLKVSELDSPQGWKKNISFWDRRDRSENFLPIFSQCCPAKGSGSPVYTSIL